MITVEKAVKSNKVKNATESGAVTKKSSKKKLLFIAGGLLAVYIGWRLFKGKNDGATEIHSPNT